MLNLAEYRKRPQALADFLPWAALVALGVIANRDGSFQRTARFRGPDLDFATPAELVSTTARLNGALRRLGSCWAVFVEAQRCPPVAIPAAASPTPPPHWSRWSDGSNSRRRARTSRAPISSPSSGCRR